MGILAENLLLETDTDTELIIMNVKIGLECISKLRTSKVTFDLGFRIKNLYYFGQSC